MAVEDRSGVQVVGLDDAVKRLNLMSARVLKVIGMSLFESAEDVMLASKRDYVPVDTGRLRASGTVRPPVARAGSVSVTLGYGGAAADYALKVHENPRAGKTGGVNPRTGKQRKSWAKVGEWKYLETPVKEMTPRVKEKLKRDTQHLAGELGRK